LQLMRCLDVDITSEIIRKIGIVDQRKNSRWEMSGDDGRNG